MDPIFTLPYSEFCVAQELRKLFPPKLGYCLLAPFSRQQKGIDLVLARRGSQRTSVAFIQVKGSCVHELPPNRRAKQSFRYRTFFNAFEVPKECDFVFLLTLYPSDTGAGKMEQVPGSRWIPRILVFPRNEMKLFVRGLKTRKGRQDSKFGFGIYDDSITGEAHIVQERGDKHRRFRDYSDHLLEKSVVSLRQFLQQSK